MLWFPVLFMRLLPGWAISLALIVHSIDALLALSFIFLIHFISANFRLGKFPVDLVIFTGRVTGRELREERPGWYERLQRWDSKASGLRLWRFVCAGLPGSSGSSPSLLAWARSCSCS